MASNLLDNSQENNGENKQQNGRDEVESRFECNICSEMAKDPVVPMCGHLFCWPCLHHWLQIRPNCPVCRSVISNDKVIPINGRGSGDTDPRDKIPPRPQAQGERTEETSQELRTDPLSEYLRRRGPITPPLNFGSNSSTMQQNQAQSSNSYGLTPQQQRIYNGLTFQQQQIYEFILDMDDGTGIDVELIRSAVQPNNEFNDDLQFLQNERIIYTTSDGDHYAIVE